MEQFFFVKLTLITSIKDLRWRRVSLAHTHNSHTRWLNFLLEDWICLISWLKSWYIWREVSELSSDGGGCLSSRRRRVKSAVAWGQVRLAASNKKPYNVIIQASRDVMTWPIRIAACRSKSAHAYSYGNRQMSSASPASHVEGLYKSEKTSTRCFHTILMSARRVESELWINTETPACATSRCKTKDECARGFFSLCPSWFPFSPAPSTFHSLTCSIF